MKNASKTVFAFINNKGGVGKSRSAVSLSEFFSARGIPHKLIDADSEAGRPGTLKRFLPEAEELVVATDTKGRRLWDRLVEATDQAQVVIADMPGSATTQFLHWFKESDLLENLANLDIQLIMVVPVCENRDSLIGLKTLWDGLGADAQKKLSWVVVKNGKDGECLTYLNESKVRGELLAAGGEEMDFEAFNFDPEMNRALDSSRAANNAAEFLTMSKIISSGRFPSLKTSRLRNFQKRLFDQFAGLRVVKALTVPAVG